MAFKMKYSIEKKYLTSGTKRRSGTKMPDVEFLVAHDTGNKGSTALNNVNYYQNSRNEMSASAHTFVDDERIIECIPLATGTPEKAWHVIYNVTTDNKMYGDDANDVGGGIELCWGPGIDSKKSYARYIWVMAYYCYKFKLNPATKIVGHQVLDPGRKIDPGNGLKYMGITYSQMLKDVVKEYNECLGKTEAKAPAPVSGSTYTIKKGDTLWGLANDNKFTVQDLLNWNPGIKAADLKVGQKINISKPKTTPKPAPAPKKKYTLPSGVYKRGSSGTAVRQIQEGLAAAFFYPDKGAKNNGVDGDYGAKTENAVFRFQLIHMGENAADGQYGPKTKAALDKEIN